MYVANFGEDRPIDRRDVIAEILTELGHGAEQTLARADSPEHRPILRANTERAIALGIFGAPNCVVDGELFWGEESLEDAIAWSLGNRPALRRAAGG